MRKDGTRDDGLRAELSINNPMYLSKYRTKELEYFCRQYPDMKKQLNELNQISTYGYSLIKTPSTKNITHDPTGDLATKIALIQHNMDIIEQAAKQADQFLSFFIFKHVTEHLSFDVLAQQYTELQGRETFYSRVRKFYYILDKMKN